MFVLLTLILSCGDSADMTGSGTGVGNGITLSGVIQDSSEQPVAGIALELVPYTYLPPSKGDLQRESIYTQTSGAGGAFTFVEVEAGSYNLWAQAKDGTMGLLTLELDDDFSSVSLDTFTVKDPVPHTIKVRGANGGTGEIRLYGSTISEQFTAGEVFTMQLPEGDNRCKVELPGYISLSGDTIVLAANDTVEVYLIGEDADSYSYTTDSLIVKEILHQNGLDSLTVEEVTVAPFDDDYDDDDDDNRRVRKLIFSGANVLPDIIGRLKPLQTLALTDGALTAIPDAVGELYYLERLELTGNNLQTLPRSIMSLENLDSVYVEGNPLDSLPRDMKQWLDALDDDD